LPVAQLDRFLFKIRMTHIDRDAELEVLATLRERKEGAGRHLPSVTRTEIVRARRVIEEAVYVHPVVHESLVDIARTLRDDRRVMQGVSTRSLVLAVPALQTRAMLYGRDYVGAEDVDALLPHIFAHRLELGAGGAEVGEVIKDAMAPSLERVARLTMEGGR
jgi:MoxR-like ATPase